MADNKPNKCTHLPLILNNVSTKDVAQIDIPTTYERMRIVY